MTNQGETDIVIVEKGGELLQIISGPAKSNWQDVI